MPVYLYRCPQCRGERETSHGMKEDPPVPCRLCNVQMERIPQYVGISFKGSGFYQNDKSKP